MREQHQADPLEARACRHLEIGYGPSLAEPPDDWEDEGYEPFATCGHCSGTGGDPWNDGIMPCEHCDGEGYAWWG